MEEQPLKNSLNEEELQKVREFKYMRSTCSVGEGKMQVEEGHRLSREVIIRGGFGFPVEQQKSVH